MTEQWRYDAGRVLNESDGPGSLTIAVQGFNLRAARAAIAKAGGEE